MKQTKGPPKVYIGDGVYAWCDGFQICLETDRVFARGPLDQIYLEPSAILAVVKYAQEIGLLPEGKVEGRTP